MVEVGCSVDRATHFSPSIFTGIAKAIEPDYFIYVKMNAATRSIKT